MYIVEYILDETAEALKSLCPFSLPCRHISLQGVSVNVNRFIPVTVDELDENNKHFKREDSLCAS
jgi:hypothetical protein